MEVKCKRKQTNKYCTSILNSISGSKNFSNRNNIFLFRLCISNYPLNVCKLFHRIFQLSFRKVSVQLIRSMGLKIKAQYTKNPDLTKALVGERHEKLRKRMLE